MDEKNPKTFYELDEFSFLKVFQSNYDIIKEEYFNLVKELPHSKWFNAFPEYVSSAKENEWKTFTFKFMGIYNTKACDYCPKTYELISSIPDLIGAEFSVLQPNTIIKPHKGFSKMILRSHLGLIIPEGDCSIIVGDDTYFWKEKEMVVFDDSFEHYAKNPTEYLRVVLMLDLPNPRWNYSAEEITKYKIENMSDPFMLSIFSKEEWMNFYNKGSF
jgi:aspartyl/asparaginyl beta-hydroxylase (cupin superfamily)